MRAIRLFLVLAGLLQAYAYEELIPARTFVRREESDECGHFIAEVELGTRRLGYLGFDSERNAILSHDRKEASLLHFNREGVLHAGKSPLGCRTPGANKDFSKLQEMLHKPSTGWQSNNEDLEYGNVSFCYSRAHDKIYGEAKKNAVPEKFKCRPVTLHRQCVSGAPNPNPSDYPSPPAYGGS